MADDNSIDPPLRLPKSSRLILIESTADTLVIRTRSEFSWLYLVTMVCILVAFAGMELVGHDPVPRAALQFFLILVAVFTAFTAFQSTYQWLRVADGGVEYNLRLGPAALTRRRASLADVVNLDTADVETESGGSVWAIITTPRWRVRFGLGSEVDSDGIAVLIREIQRLKGRAAKGQRDSR